MPDLPTVQIHVSLQDEGVDVWRPVEAVSIGPNLYRIVSRNPNPMGERWEFKEGEIVRCRQVMFDGGQSGLVAFEKVPSGATSNLNGEAGMLIDAPSRPYRAEFPAGTYVRIVDRPLLERFMREWTLHHPLSPEQLEYAGSVAMVRDVGFYHGGDALYHLEHVPGTWHEACLKADVREDV